MFISYSCQFLDVNNVSTNCIQIGWVLHPIFSKEGDYPPLMKERVDRNSIAEGRFHSRLPSFTQDEIELLKGN